MAACSAGSVSAQRRCVTPSSVTVHASGVRCSAVKSTSREVVLTDAPGGRRRPGRRLGGAPVPAGTGPAVIDEQDGLKVATYRGH